MAKDGAASSFTAARAGSRPNRNWLKYGIPAALAFCFSVSVLQPAVSSSE